MLIVYEILLGLFELHFCLGFNRSAYLILFSHRIDSIPEVDNKQLIEHLSDCIDWSKQGL